MFICIPGYTKLMVAVGYTIQGFSDKVEIIDLENPISTCTDLPKYPMQVDRVVGTLGQNENPIICGGYPGSRECYSYVDKIWNSFPSMNTVRGHAASLPSPYPNKSHIFLVTGGVENTGDTNTGEILTEDGWQNMPEPLPVKIAFHCAVLVNATTAFIIGGRQDDQNAAPMTYFFNTENEVWIEGPLLKTGRREHSCARIQKDSQSSQYSVIVAGGVNSNDVTLSSVELLEVGASEWVAGPELPEKILGSSMVEYSDGGVFYIGGLGGGRYHYTIFYLAHGQAEWVEMPQKLKIATAWATSFLVPDEITNCS